jgi:AcrR family transcriptional regulator
VQVAAETDAARPARRRGAALEAAIEAAVVGIVVEQGAAAVTMEAVAARCGTSKPVLYRRWTDRADLLRDTLVRFAEQEIPSPDTGSVRGDLIAVLQGWVRAFTGPLAPAVGAVVAAATHDPEVRAALQDGAIAVRKREMVALFERGAARGEVRPDLPVDLARELAAAILWHRFLVTGDPVDDDLVVRVVDEVVLPFVRG